MMGRMASNPWKAAAHAIVTALSDWIYREQESSATGDARREEAALHRAQRRRLALKALEAGRGREVGRDMMHLLD
jgi:hypothetical protein